jgi:hypothetical protein
MTMPRRPSASAMSLAPIDPYSLPPSPDLDAQRQRRRADPLGGDLGLLTLAHALLLA